MREAKQLRDHFTLELDDGREIYLKLFSSDPDKNHYQVANQVKPHTIKIVCFQQVPYGTYPL